MYSSVRSVASGSGPREELDDQTPRRTRSVGVHQFGDGVAAPIRVARHRAHSERPASARTSGSARAIGIAQRRNSEGRPSPDNATTGRTYSSPLARPVGVDLFIVMRGAPCTSFFDKPRARIYLRAFFSLRSLYTSVRFTGWDRGGCSYLSPARRNDDMTSVIARGAVWQCLRAA